MKNSPSIPHMWPFQPWEYPYLDKSVPIGTLGHHGPFASSSSPIQLTRLLAPSIFLILVSPVRLLRLRSANLKVLPNYAGAVKTIITTAIAVVELAALILWLKSTKTQRGVAVLVHACRIMASLSLCVLSFFEHGRSITPSTVLMIYLFASIICQPLELQQNWSANLSTFCIGLGLKLVLLVTESRSKSSYLRKPYSELPPEQTCNSINRAFLFWINTLIMLGNSKALAQSDLPHLDDGLRSRQLRERMEESWFQAIKGATFADANTGNLLLWVVFKFFLRSVLLNSIPRLIMIGFRYMQPILINNTIRYVTEPSAEEDKQQNTGYFLLLTAFVIYVGMGVSFCIYYQTHNRIKVQSRGALVGLIHARCLTMRDGVYEDASAVMHMSSDTEVMENFAWLCQEMWAQVIELMIGITMLSAQLGWWCLMPLVIIAASSQLVRWTGRLVSESMVGWQKAKQDRIALTISMIDYIKSIKMMGMTKYIVDAVQGSRINDLLTGLGYRWIVVYFNLTVNGISILTPVITLVAYAVDAYLRGKESLDANTAFTSIAIITLVTIPANFILALLPQIATAHGCASRTQGYLLGPSMEDKRMLLQPRVPDQATPAIVFTDVALRPAVKADICLKALSFECARRSLNIICGPVGAGKTTLAKAILGEVIPDDGTVGVSTKRIGYCAQNPWLINASIKAIICGTENEDEIDQEWYTSVIHACGLDDDLRQLDIGDTGAVGSRGVTLSGGQRQRVTLARAVYPRPEIVILDDVLSALDAKTEAHVTKMLLGSGGIFRKQGTTVVLITHTTQYLHQADKIFVLGNSGIEEQGTWEDLRTSSGYISKLQLATSKTAESVGLTSSTEIAAPISTRLASKSSSPDVAELDHPVRTGDLSVYFYYFQCVSMLTTAIFFICIVADGVGLAVVPSVLRAWSEAGGAQMWLYTTLYAVSSVLSLAATGSVICSTLILIAPKAGEVLHLRILKTITSAPLAYFTMTESGSILNRFTEDMTYVDHTLPFHLMNAFWYLSRLISQLVLLFITQIYVAVGTPFLFFVLYLLQKLYLCTSRQIRLMDIELRAEVLSNFLETLEGVPHIRAFGWQSRYVSQNVQKLDISQRPHYMMLSIQQWLSLVLDMLVAGLSVLVVGLAVAFQASTSGGQIGVALNIILTISTALTRLLQSWTQLDTSLGAVWRIKTLESTLLPENKEFEHFEPPPNWPATGSIEFREVVASYNSKCTALDGISLTVHPGQKVGICGRTGSGKSTLLLSILRLVELRSGAILVDGIDLSTLRRESTRTRFVAVPQDAFVLSHSIRFNIDPSGVACDEQIIAALETVKLWDIIQSRIANAAAASRSTTAVEHGSADPGQQKAHSPVDALDAPLKQSPLSHGQFHLLGLARAILQKTRSKILLLDEATSSVDEKTEKFMQQIINDEFPDHTVITIAHRLNTIKDVDIIVVMDNGKVVEVGSPNQLLNKKVGSDDVTEVEGDGPQPLGRAWFKEMWDKSNQDGSR